MQLTIDQSPTIIDTRVFSFPNALISSETPSFLYYHLVFRASESLDSIGEQRRKNFYGFIFGCARTLNGEIESIGGTGSSIQILVTLKPAETPADFIRKLKLFTASWAKRKLNLPDFEWRGVEVSTVSRSECIRTSAVIQSRNFLF
jgi:Transposase IS200 like